MGTKPTQEEGTQQPHLPHGRCWSGRGRARGQKNERRQAGGRGGTRGKPAARRAGGRVGAHVPASLQATRTHTTPYLPPQHQRPRRRRRRQRRGRRDAAPPRNVRQAAARGGNTGRLRRPLLRYMGYVGVNPPQRTLSRGDQASGGAPAPRRASHEGHTKAGEPLGRPRTRGPARRILPPPPQSGRAARPLWPASSAHARVGQSTAALDADRRRPHRPA